MTNTHATIKMTGYGNAIMSRFNGEDEATLNYQKKLTKMEGRRSGTACKVVELTPEVERDNEEYLERKNAAYGTTAMIDGWTQTAEGVYEKNDLVIRKTDADVKCKWLGYKRQGEEEHLMSRSLSVRDAVQDVEAADELLR